MLALTQTAWVKLYIFVAMENFLFWLGENSNSAVPSLMFGLLNFMLMRWTLSCVWFWSRRNPIAITEKLKKDLHNDNEKLLIFSIKYHRFESRGTAVRWIKTVLAGGGIDSKYRAGSIHPASMSTTRVAWGMPTGTILAKAGWTSETTFAKSYNKEITQVSDPFQKTVLGSVERMRGCVFLILACWRSGWFL